MADFEDQQAEALKISGELASCLLALGIDWHDAQALRLLAREALDLKPDSANLQVKPGDVKTMAKVKFFGLVGLMLKTMEEGADRGLDVHGSDIWKAVARALWAEKGNTV